MSRFVCLETFTYNGEPTEIRAYNPEYIVRVSPIGSGWTDIVIANGNPYSGNNNTSARIKGAFKDVVRLLEGDLE